MLMQPEMPLSPYLALYDLVVPHDHKLRKIKKMVYFSFVYDELKKNYCEDNGRGAIDPIRMFKYHSLPEERLLLIQHIRKLDREKASVLPDRPQSYSTLSDVLAYSEAITKLVRADHRLLQYPAIQERMNILEEAIEDT